MAFGAPVVAARAGGLAEAGTRPDRPSLSAGRSKISSGADHHSPRLPFSWSVHGSTWSPGGRGALQLEPRRRRDARGIPPRPGRGPKGPPDAARSVSSLACRIAPGIRLTLLPAGTDEFHRIPSGGLTHVEGSESRPGDEEPACCLRPVVPSRWCRSSNRPVVEHLIRLAARHGVTEVILTTHYLPEQIRRFLGSGDHFGVRLSYAIEDKPLGTAGSVNSCRTAQRDLFGAKRRCLDGF